MRDYYAILGIPRSAGPDSINDAKRRLSFLYHPDTRPKDLDPDFAEERIREVNEAWEVLSDPERRAAYDRVAGLAGTDGALPQLSLTPAEITLTNVDARGVARFAVEVTQTGGTPFDPAKHDLEVRCSAPWDRATLRYDAGGATSLPLTLTMEVNLSGGGFESGAEYVGDFEINAVAR